MHRTHYGTPGEPICNIYGRSREDTATTMDKDAVTCKRCKKLIKKGLVKHNVGIFSERMKHNPREAAFAEQWERENVRCVGINYGFGVLQDIFIDVVGTGIMARQFLRLKITKRDRFIVATVIQWLGSNCGMGFLHAAFRRCGYKIINTDDRHDSWRWGRDIPQQAGLYWWWNGDPNAGPIDVRLDFANGADDGLYALPLQHGWNRFQRVADMGGYWAACTAPIVPHELRMRHAGGADV